MRVTDSIALGWCHHDNVDNAFAQSVVRLALERYGRILSVHTVKGTGLLAQSRNILVKQFLATDDDWLLMMDTDQRIPIASYDKLVEAADSIERPVMSGLVFGVVETEDQPKPFPCIFKESDGNLSPFDDYPADSVVEVKAAGTGFLLVHRSVFFRMSQHYSPITGPDWCWFQDGPVGDNTWISEDHMFCARLRTLEIPIHAHTGAVADHHKLTWIGEPS